MDSPLVCSTPDWAVVLDDAIQDHQAGRLAAAEVTYRRILAHEPNHPDALHLLGMLACDRSDPQTALRLTEAAIQQAPARAAFHNTRARALLGLGLPQEAEAAYRTAWSLRPDTAEIANNLGCLLQSRGDIDGAVEWLSKASILARSSIEIACNLGDALAAQGALTASLAVFRHAVRLNPEAADTHDRFGHALVALRRFNEAAASYRWSIRLRPEHASSHNNLGLVLRQQGDTAGAIRSFQTALRTDPDCADAHYNLGSLLLIDGRIDESRCCYEQANRAAPLHGAARWARCMVELPILYDTSEQIVLQRHRYAQQLSLLIDAAEDPAVARALAQSVGASQPFFLPYQGLSDHELQSRYGALLTRLLRSEPLPDLPPPVLDQPIRVGIVSGFFCEHTVWRLMLKGWLSQLDPNRFQILVYYTGDTEDDQTALARRLCTRFVAGRGSDIRAAIQHDRPHVLLYPELGMDHGALRLAAERLAPVQCVAWGQPETSGLPTIDYFLSSALMEPDDAASHYTEKLITLPNLGIHYAPDDHVASVITRASLGLRPGATLFWCGQALYKYLPQNDDVFVRIAAAVGDCQFLFIGFAKSPLITQQFRTRLQNAFAARGLDAALHCVFLDPMPQDRFLATIGLADIMLDSIGWSGGKSTLDALRQAPVIVTHAGPLMRGRHTMAILTCIGVTETIATTIDEYVDIAVRLAANPLQRAALRVRMAAGRHRAIGDMTPIRALESFLAQAVRHERSPEGFTFRASSEYHSHYA